MAGFSLGLLVFQGFAPLGAPTRVMGWSWVELSHGRPPEGRERAALRALAALLAESQRVLLHCSAGQHRTGMVAYMLLRSLGIEQGEVLERISALRPATRAGLEQDRTRLVEPEVSEETSAKAGNLVALPVLNGLHHDYRRAGLTTRIL